MFGKKTADGAKTVPTAEFIVAAVVLLFFEAFLLFNFFVKPQAAGSAAARETLAERTAALSRYREDKQDAAGLANQLNDLETRISEAEIKLPRSLHNEDISIMIGEFAGICNVSVESLSFQERRLTDPSEYASPGADTAGSGLFGAAGPKAGTEAGAGANVQSALFDEAPPAGGTLSLQGAQVGFISEFHTVGPFLKLFEDSERRVRVKSVSITRIQENELRGVVNLEYAALSPDAEQVYPGLNVAGESGGDIAKDSIFRKYNGFVEDNVDPTILLLSEEDDYDPDFYMVLKASTSNETKVSYGVYPRVETELRSNVNNAIRAKLTINGTEDQFDYVYSLASYQKSEKRKLTAAGGKLRVKILSCQRMGDNDNVAILLDVDNNTDLPLDIIVVNDDVLDARFNLGITKGTVNVVPK